MRYAILILAACGGNGGGDDGDGGMSGGDGSTLPSKYGYVFLQSYDAMNAPNTPTRGGSANAGFSATAATCPLYENVGPCLVSRCNTTTPVMTSAGTVTISGAAQPITLMPGANNMYAPFTTMTPLFNGGENVTFAAAGAEVPAFSKSLAMPSKATITSPPEPAAAAYLIVNRAQDFTVSWSGGGSGQVQVSLFGPNNGSATCKFAASAGTGKVPTAALQMVDAGNGAFAMAVIAEATVNAGDFGVSVSAYFNAVWPDASIVSGPLTLQ